VWNCSYTIGSGSLTSEVEEDDGAVVEYISNVVQPSFQVQGPLDLPHSAFDIHFLPVIAAVGISPTAARQNLTARRASDLENIVSWS
jgi:hypothetical protein